MNWKGILWWMALGLLTWLGVSLLSGMIFGLSKTDLTGPLVIRGLGGMTVPFLFFFKFLPIISLSLLIPIIIWALIVHRFPNIESSNGRLAGSLALFAMAFSTVVWWSFPFDSGLAIWAALFALISLMLPRFITERLSYGKFAVKQIDGGIGGGLHK